MITFYGKHYMAYFYSEKFDQWAQFNDESIKKIGNFKEVTKKCISGRQIPVTLFYERQDIIRNIITQAEMQSNQSSQSNDSKSPDKNIEKKIYFLDKNIKKNNFWTS